MGTPHNRAKAALARRPLRSLTLREYIEKEAPRLREPPRDIDEIRDL